MRQIIIDLGTWTILGRSLDLRIFGYGLMLVLGFLLGIALAQWRARRAGENPEVISRCGVLALVGGVVGARLAYVIQHWDYFGRSGNLLGEMLDITSGGLIYYGGLGLATAMVLGYLAIKRLPVRRYLDILAVSIMVGLAFGRAGCFLNGCCYGAVCDEHWPLAMKFPMFSKPLLKVGDGENPYSHGTVSASPPYAAQLEKGLVRPDSRLLVMGTRDTLHPPRELHGRLAQDQLEVMLGDESAARALFTALAGGDARLDEPEWRGAKARPGGFLRGSEFWDEALLFDINRDGRLDFREAWAYQSARRLDITKRFDADFDGQLGKDERAAANEYLQADLLALAAQSTSLAVKPSQLLAMFNALLLAGLLALFYRARTREGQVFALLMVMYPITRFIEELIRDDNPHDLLTGLLTHNQWTSAATLAAGLALLVILRRLPASAGSHRPAAVLGSENSLANQRKRN